MCPISPSPVRPTTGTRDGTETFPKTRRFAPEKHAVTTMDTALVATKVRAPALRFSVPFGCHSLSPNFFYTDLPHRGSSVTRYVLVLLHPSGKASSAARWESRLPPKLGILRSSVVAPLPRPSAHVSIIARIFLSLVDTVFPSERSLLGSEQQLPAE